jgi:hypothetical protein
MGRELLLEWLAAPPVAGNERTGLPPDRGLLTPLMLAPRPAAGAVFGAALLRFPDGKRRPFAPTWPWFAADT